MVKIRFVLLFIASLFMVIGCNDDTSELGAGVTPSDDNMEVGVLSIKPELFTQYHPDSIRTDDLSSFMLGGLYHEDFGLFRADIVTQIRFDSIEFSNNEEWEVDSVELIILQNDIYGDTAAINELKVYELNKSIDNYTTYYSNADEYDYYSETDYLGNLRYEPRDVDNATQVYYSSNDSAWQYRIVVPLDKRYGQRLFDGFSSYGNDVEEFQKLFKGLYVKSTFGNKSLNLVNISTKDDEDYLTAVALHLTHSYSYIKKKASGIEENRDTVVNVIQYYYVNDECGRFSIFHHDFDGIDVDEKISSNSSPEIVKSRGGGALTMRLRLPELRESSSFDWVKTDKNFIINKAIMTVKLATDQYDNNRFTPPITLKASTDTVGSFLWYDNYKTESYFGGTYDKDTEQYQFNITYFVQTLLSDPDFENRDLFFFNSENAIAPWVSMFYGKDSVDIDIYYTKY